MSIQKILVMADFSDASKQALEYGLQLAEKIGATVMVQHVYYIPPDAGGDMFITREAFEGYEDSLREEFENLKSNLSFPLPQDFRFVLCYGDLVDEMNGLITQESVDLVVAGNRGGGFLTNILGSNTIKIIQRAQCPVLSVPAKALYHPIRRIAFATDLKHTPEQIFSRLVDFAQAFKAQVDIIHVREKEEEVAPEEPSFLDKLLAPVAHTFHYIWAKDIEKGIEQHLIEHQNDLIVLVPRRHPFFDRLFQKSISRQIAFHVRAPLLSIHE